jgi:Tol biopolymer transport system component
MQEIRTMRLLPTILIAAALAAPLPAQTPGAVALRAAIETETVKGDLKAALQQYAEIAAKYAKSDRASAASALLHIAECHEKMGDSEASALYERVLREYSDQKDAAARARTRLSAAEARAPRMPAAQQVWSGPGVDPWASLSPDGRTLVAAAPGGIQLRSLDGSDSKLIPLQTGFVEFPILSPDRKWVAFGWANPARNFEYDLQVMGTAPGSTPRTLIANPAAQYYVPHGWSADGKAILVSIEDTATMALAWIDIASGKRTQLRSFNWNAAQSVSLSPDRRWIAYYTPAREQLASEIRLLSSDASADRPLVKDAGSVTSLAWTRDGTRLLFASDRSGSDGLWWVATGDGTPPELLKAQTGKVSLKGVTRDGTLLYAQSHRGQDVFRAPLAAAGRESGKALLTESYRGTNTRPAWSPDGSRVAFISYRKEPDTNIPRFTGTLVIRALASGAERTIETPLQYPSNPMWSPKGDAILVTARNPRNSTCIYRIDVESGRVAELFDLEMQAAPDATLSPDGKTLFIANGKVTAISLDSGARRSLGIEGKKRDLAMSPDGAQLAMVVATGTATPATKTELVTVAPDGSNFRVLFTEPVGSDSAGALAWSADSRTLYFTRSSRHPQAPETPLWSIPASGGEPKPTDFSADWISSMSISPDGTTLVYGGGPRVVHEYWTLANLTTGVGSRKN